jgi:hypothetical protein
LESWIEKGKKAVVSTLEKKRGLSIDTLLLNAFAAVPVPLGHGADSDVAL